MQTQARTAALSSVEDSERSDHRRLGQFGLPLNDLLSVIWFGYEIKNRILTRQVLAGVVHFVKYLSRVQNCGPRVNSQLGLLQNNAILIDSTEEPGRAAWM